MTEIPQSPTPAPAPAPAPAPPPQEPPAGGKPDLTMAWLSHLLLLLTGFVGPLVIWAMKKDTDEKIAIFHAKQCWIMGIAAMVASMVTCGCASIVVLIYAIMGLVQTSKGEPFKYYFIADKWCAEEFAAAYPDQPAPPQS